MKETRTQLVEADRTTWRDKNKVEIKGDRSKVFVDGELKTDTSNISMQEIRQYGDSPDRQFLHSLGIKELIELDQVIKKLIDFDGKDKEEE